MGLTLRHYSGKGPPGPKMQGKEKNADAPGQEILVDMMNRVAAMDAYIAMQDS